jgi:hypothetical protein
MGLFAVDHGKMEIRSPRERREGGAFSEIHSRNENCENGRQKKKMKRKWMKLEEVLKLPEGTFVRRNTKPKTRLYVGKSEVTQAHYSAYHDRYVDGAFMIEDRSDLAAEDWEICSAAV